MSESIPAETEAVWLNYGDLMLEQRKYENLSARYEEVNERRKMAGNPASLLVASVATAVSAIRLRSSGKRIDDYAKRPQPDLIAYRRDIHGMRLVEDGPTPDVLEG